jgi:hypothetical protein
MRLAGDSPCSGKGRYVLTNFALPSSASEFFVNIAMNNGLQVAPLYFVLELFKM